VLATVVVSYRLLTHYFMTFDLVTIVALRRPFMWKTRCLLKMLAYLTDGHWNGVFVGSHVPTSTGDIPIVYIACDGVVCDSELTPILTHRYIVAMTLARGLLIIKSTLS